MSKTTGNTTTGKSGDPNTTTSDNKSGSGTGSGTTTGKQNEKDTQSNLVEQGTPAEVVVQIQTENKTEKKSVPSIKKTAKKKTPPKERSETEKIKDIQSLLEGVFMVASLKAGSHWQLQPDESKQIAVPLSRILERYDLLSKASEVSDPVALVVAAATIVFPRIMVTKLTADSKKTETLKKNGVMNVEQKRNLDGNSGSNGDPAKTTNSTNDGQYIKSIHNEIQTGI